MLGAAQDSFYQRLEAFTLADCVADGALIDLP